VLVVVLELELLPPQAVRDSARHRDSARAIHFFIFLVPPHSLVCFFIINRPATGQLTLSKNLFQ
jgi:hypothetical protein